MKLREIFVSLFACSYTIMTSTELFSFKLDGRSISAGVHSGNRSFLSHAYVDREDLPSSGNIYSAGLSVLLPTGWATCVMDFCMSESLDGTDLCLGLDWQGHMKELCDGTGIVLPPDLVCIF